MKKKMQIFLLCIGILTALTTCDMFRIEDMQQQGQELGEKELTANERDALEKNGRFLKLINLPLNTQVSNVISVSVSNSSSTVGKLNKNSPIMIYRETDTCTAYLPLVSNDDKEFLNTGLFFTAFSVYVDVVTKYIVDVSDQFTVPFSDGRGQVDVNKLPSLSIHLDTDQSPGSVSKELTENERDELEKTGHFLKLVNMPLNTQVPNVFSVSVSNSSSAIGKLDKNSPICIYREIATNTCTVYLPLVNNNSNGYLEPDFLETGFFYTAFTIHVDALTKYIVDTSDHFIVLYTDGRGQADVNFLPSPVVIIHEPHYLTIFNLPMSVSIYNFSKVFIHNQTGAVARCMDYSQIVLSANDNKVSAKIPLYYNSLDQDFTENGVFYVLFDINVDVNTRYTLTKEDQIEVTFVNGNGHLDILNLPDKPVPYLTIKSLPLNATKQHVSNVNIYNLAGTVAACADNKNIVVIKGNEYLTFLIPLTSASDNKIYFQNSGRFAVEFTVDVDYENQISYKKEDNLILQFTNGSAEFDVNSFFGFFNASLTNMNDSAKPIIKAGSSFDIYGNRVTVTSNYSVTANTPSSSCLMYLYAYKYADSELFFEFSTTVPTYNTKRKGWYNGNKRALWKMIYLYSSNQFLFKTYVEDAFPHFGKNVLTNDSDYSQLITSKAVAKSINGASNLAPETITLDPGIYVIELKGAGGGAGRNFNGTSTGGYGGRVREILTLTSKTSFTAFTGSGGGTAPNISSSGKFDILTTKNYYTYTQQNSSSSSLITGSSFSEGPYSIAAINLQGVSSVMGGGGGGGGGSGSFLYSQNDKYFLVAGGGGGASGGSYLTPGGGGGAGGSIGPGAAGGRSGSMSQGLNLTITDNVIVTSVLKTLYSNIDNYNYSVSANAGGTGGGFDSSRASDGLLSLNNYVLQGGAGTSGYSSSSDFNIDSHISFLSVTISGQYPSATPLNTYTSSHKAFTARSTFYFAAYSDWGENAANPYYSSGHEYAWLNASNVGGYGAAAPALPSVSFSSGTTPGGNAGEFGSSWNGDNPSFTKMSITISSRSGNSGESGGNNRTSTRGDGASPGSAGSVTIHKIF